MSWRQPIWGGVSALLASLLVLAGCGHASRRLAAVHPLTAAPAASTQLNRDGLRMPPVLDPHNIYAADAAGQLSRAVQGDRPLVYVPNSGDNTLTEIDPQTFRVVRHFAVGMLPQHVVPSYDLRTLWVTNDQGNTLIPIDPRTGLPGQPAPVSDPYNMYFTPEGRYAVVMAEAQRRIDFREAHTMKLHHSLAVPACAGVNHADFTADGRLMFASCEFGSAMVVVNVAREQLSRTIPLPAGSSPQDVKLSPDGRVFYVADRYHGGVYLFDAHRFRRLKFIHTGADAHGLYPSRDARMLYVTDRGAGAVSVISFARRRVVRTFRIPGGSPDMGGVSADGHTLWLSGRYDAAVYAVDTRTGRVRARIPVGTGPHGLCVWPQPGRYSLGHTGVLR